MSVDSELDKATDDAVKQHLADVPPPDLDMTKANVNPDDLLKAIEEEAKAASTAESSETVEDVEETGEEPEVEEPEGTTAVEETEEVPQDEQATPGETEDAVALDPVLLHAGERAGLSAEDIIALGEKAPEVLGRLQGGFDRISTDLGNLGRQEIERRRTAPPAQVGPTPHRTATEATQATGDVLKDLGITLSDEVEPEVARAVNALATAVVGVRGDMTTLREDAAPLQKQLDEQDRLRYEAESDAFFQEISENYSDLYGKGPIRRLAAGSAALKARRALDKEAVAIGTGAILRGEPLTVREVCYRALSLVASERQEQLARTKVLKEVKAHGRRTVARPTRRRTKRLLSPDQQAEAAVTAEAKKRGIDLD